LKLWQAILHLIALSSFWGAFHSSRSIGDKKNNFFMASAIVIRSSGGAEIPHPLSATKSFPALISLFLCKLLCQKTRPLKQLVSQRKIPAFTPFKNSYI